MSHHCHAKGCQTKCKPEFLMCPRHWRMVPGQFQRLVWAHYRPGQCDDKQPSEKWHAAADIAIAAVALKESRISEDTYERIKAKAREVLSVRSSGNE